MSRFDVVPDRSGIGMSMKWKQVQNQDVIPLWVADMDFPAPPSVLEALQDLLTHGVLGYSVPPQELDEVVCQRLETLYQWHVDPSWIVWIPGIVTGLHLACLAGEKAKQGVATMIPIYPPFISAPKYAECPLFSIPLDDRNGRWAFSQDQVDMTRSCGLFLLCNPHNPTGRVWTKEELTIIAEHCLRHDIILCSDEIHCDLLLDNVKHIPIATLGSDVEQQSITFMSPSKTYNIPGLGCSFAIIPNPILRRKFNRIRRGLIPDVTLPGYIASLAAYTDTSSWLEELLDYLRENRDLVFQSVRDRLPGLSLTHPGEATYLAWIDTHATSLEHPADFFAEHGVKLSNGLFFGRDRFVRLNFGCSRNLLEKALDRMEKALTIAKI